MSSLPYNEWLGNTGWMLDFAWSLKLYDMYQYCSVSKMNLFCVWCKCWFVFGVHWCVHWFNIWNEQQAETDLHVFICMNTIYTQILISAWRLFLHLNCPFSNACDKLTTTKTNNNIQLTYTNTTFLFCNIRSSLNSSKTFKNALASGVALLWCALTLNSLMVVEKFFY